MEQINLEYLISRKTRSYPYVELDESYIGQHLSENEFLIVRYNKKLYYIHKYKKILASDIDRYLRDLVRNADDKSIKERYNLTKKNILEMLYRKINIAKKELVKGYLVKSVHNISEESALNFLKVCKIV